MSLTREEKRNIASETECAREKNEFHAIIICRFVHDGIERQKEWVERSKSYRVDEKLPSNNNICSKQTVRTELCSIKTKRMFIVHDENNAKNSDKYNN